MAWLLDTNILSEIRKPRPEPKVVNFVSSTPLDELYISAVWQACAFLHLKFRKRLVAEVAHDKSYSRGR